MQSATGLSKGSTQLVDRDDMPMRGGGITRVEAHAGRASLAGMPAQRIAHDMLRELPGLDTTSSLAETEASARKVAPGEVLTADEPVAKARMTFGEWRPADLAPCVATAASVRALCAGDELELSLADGRRVTGLLAGPMEEEDGVIVMTLKPGPGDAAGKNLLRELGEQQGDHFRVPWTDGITVRPRAFIALSPPAFYPGRSMDCLSRGDVVSMGTSTCVIADVDYEKGTLDVVAPEDSSPPLVRDSKSGPGTGPCTGLKRKEAEPETPSGASRPSRMKGEPGMGGLHPLSLAGGLWLDEHPGELRVYRFEFGSCGIRPRRKADPLGLAELRALWRGARLSLNGADCVFDSYTQTSRGCHITVFPVSKDGKRGAIPRHVVLPDERCLARDSGKNCQPLAVLPVARMDPASPQPLNPDMALALRPGTVLQNATGRLIAFSHLVRHRGDLSLVDMQGHVHRTRAFRECASDRLLDASHLQALVGKTLRVPLGAGRAGQSEHVVTLRALERDPDGTLFLVVSGAAGFGECAADTLSDELSGATRRRFEPLGGGSYRLAYGFFPLLRDEPAVATVRGRSGLVDSRGIYTHPGMIALDVGTQVRMGDHTVTWDKKLTADPQDMYIRVRSDVPMDGLSPTTVQEPSDGHPYYLYTFGRYSEVRPVE